MIKIVSGWSNPGGSTIAHINLTNALNNIGRPTLFYGPHDWHLDQCNGKKIVELEITENDIVILHFVNPEVVTQIKCKKKFLYCHETNLYPLKQVPNLTEYDAIVFVSNSQKKWHSVNIPSVIIPPIVQKFNWTKPNNQLKIAGVIGSIDEHKQTAVAIGMALVEGFDQVYLFGQVTDYPYYNEAVAPFINSGKAILKPHTDQETMYNSVEKVFLASKRETFGLVKAECQLAGIPFSCPERSLSGEPVIEKDEVIQRWITLMEV